MDPLWTLEEMQSVGEVVSTVNEVELQGVSIDSRQINKGDLFIALSGDPGPRFHGGVDNPRDGHEFISSAISNGASVVLLSTPPSEISVPYVKVKDTLDGLWGLAEVSRARCGGQVVVITGSAGKTTAKTWLTGALESLCEVHASAGSLNNHWGVPLSLSRMAKSTEVGVIEIGTNHPGEISPLSQLAKPNISVLLNVLPAHIGNFGSLGNLREEKLSIAHGLSEDGTFVLPFGLATGESGEITFGFEADADANATFEVVNGISKVQANICGEPVEYQLAETGEYRVLTSLAVLAVVSQLGYNVSAAAKNLAHLDSPKGRGNKHLLAGITVIDDSYNANPVSMGYAIRNLVETPCEGRRIALLGEILELGDEADRYHAEVSSHFVSLDQVITFGAGFEAHSGGSHLDSIQDLDLDRFLSELNAGDIVLVKGSNKVFWQHGFVDQLLARLEA